jgi:hypothetical protein
MSQLIALHQLWLYRDGSSFWIMLTKFRRENFFCYNKKVQSSALLMSDRVALAQTMEQASVQS